MENGELSVGDKVVLKVDGVRRNAIRRNHSACHLLQAALRQVLGAHVEQAGSYVDENRVRFDFAHYAPLSEEELDKVETLVNRHILAAESVNTVETDVEEAKKAGAMALFGEKYGKVVRMVKMGTSPPSFAAVPMYPTPAMWDFSRSFPKPLLPPAPEGSRELPDLACFS